MRKRVSYRNAFSMLEVALAIIIFSVITITMIKQVRSANRTEQLQKELDFRTTFEHGMKFGFGQILDYFEPVCSNITSDAQTKWGWGHNSCSSSSPFPAYLATEKIRYRLNLSSLSAQDRQNLIDSIVASYSPYCTLDATTNSTIDLMCPNLSNLTYNLGAGNVANAHTVGSDIDPLRVPTAIMTINRREGDGTVSTQQYNISFLDVYEKRRNFSNEKFNLLRNVLKTYYNNQLTVEVANAPTTGLNSTDDEFVPWAWKAFGDNTSDVLGSICNLGGGTTCSNLNTDNIWRSNLSGTGLYMRRLDANLLSSDTRMNVDGFGNQITLYPFMSQCTNNDISTCTVTAPPVPQQDYFNLMRPPYMSVLYIDTYKDKTTTAPSYGRVYVSY